MADLSTSSCFKRGRFRRLEMSSKTLKTQCFRNFKMHLSFLEPKEDTVDSFGSLSNKLKSFEILTGLSEVPENIRGTAEF